MSVPDGVRGSENEGGLPAAEAKASEAIRAGVSHQGVTASIPQYPTAGRGNEVPPSSNTKWIVAGVVLALLVFGITYGLTLIGTSGKAPVTPIEDGGSTVEQLKLSFVTQKMPRQEDGELLPKPPIDVEVHKEGWLDYWFENKNEKPVSVGLIKVSCTCSGAEVFLLPVGSATSPGREEELAKTATPTKLTVGAEAFVTVAPRQVGWVRLKWSGESKPDKLDLTLWLNSPAVGPFPNLEARLQFHEPLMVETKLPFDAVSVSKLPYTKSIVCWSVTRKSLTIVAEITGGRKGTAEPLELGVPVPISPKECRAQVQLARDQNVMSAYQIPVTLRAEASAGKQVDAGPFRRRVELSLEGSASEPLVVDVYGTTLGDVNVLGLNSGRVDFPRFDSKLGSTVRTLTLQSTTGSKKLEIDQERTSEFLKVELLPGPTEAATTWQLKVHVREGTVSGPFPRDKPEVLRDSAVYVRPVGDAKARATRIAVEGSATD